MQPMPTLDSFIQRAKKIETIRQEAHRMQDAKIGKATEARYYKLCVDLVKELAQLGEKDGAPTPP